MAETDCRGSSIGYNLCNMTHVSTTISTMFLPKHQEKGTIEIGQLEA